MTLYLLLCLTINVHSVIDDIPQEMDFKNIVFIGNNVQPELTEKKFKNKFGNNKK